MTSKIFTFRFFQVFCVFYFFVFSLAFAFYIYDPFCFFHAPILREKTFLSDSRNMRYALSGIIQYNDFDSVIAGSSMLEKTISQDAENKLNGKWINLSAPSFSFIERDILFSYLFKIKNIKSVIYSLESYYLLNDSIETYQKTNHPLNHHLLFGGGGYHSLLFLKYYFNKHFIHCLLKWSKEPQCVGKKTIGFNGNETFQSGFKNWNLQEKNLFKNELKKQYKKIPFDFQNRKEFLKQKILKHIENNPHIQFYFILPTQSRFFYKIPYAWNNERSPEQFFNHYQTITLWFIQQCEKYNNVQFFGLDLLDYADDLNNYWDARHYLPDLNILQLESIQKQQNILNANNAENYFKKLKEKIKNYDIQPYIQQIKEK